MSGFVGNVSVTFGRVRSYGHVQITVGNDSYEMYRQGWMFQTG